ncbi:hypothetical protein KY289_000736 [Solanum tuberosum]|nr:hypothetical protein KY289_000736 [Solanum tuberosum]
MDRDQGPWYDLRTVGRDLANFLSWVWGGLAVVNHGPPARVVELAAIDLPEDQHTPTSSPPTIFVYPKVVQPKDISEFEDFSTSHPKQLPDQCNVSLDQPFSIPDESPTPVANIHISSDAQKVNSIILDIEEVKEFLMDYVDKKFENLESLIKKNHSQLMESRHREDNQPLKDVVGKPLTCTVEVSEQKGNVDPQSSTFQFDKQPSSPIQIDLADEVDVSVNEIDHTIRNHQPIEYVSELQHTNENTYVDTVGNDPKKDDEADQAPQDINEVTMNENGVDTVQHNIRQFVPDTVTVDTSWVTKGLLKTHANNQINVGLIRFLGQRNWFTFGATTSFVVEFAQDIMQQNSDSIDCGLYVATFAEYLNDQFEIPLDGFLPEYLRNRYGALLWTYGSKKAKGGYVSENNDPPKPKGLVTPPPEENLVHTN